MKIKSVLFIFIWRLLLRKTLPFLRLRFPLQILRSALFRTDFRRSVFAISSQIRFEKDGPKWTRTTDLTLIRRAL